MRQWSALLLDEIATWPQVTSRPMFGMTAVYRDGLIFGVLPRTRAMDTAYSVSFKVPAVTAEWKRQLESDSRIIAAPGARWISFELESGDDIPAALQWFERAYQAAQRRSRKRQSS
jgi:hypothetical protein